jgi:hypothetical protein
MMVFRYWSPTHGAWVVRLALADENGAEYYMILPSERGRAWRQVRDEAVETIMQAIHEGLPPGEVRVG